jgi:hypothetical protein
MGGSCEKEIHHHYPGSSNNGGDIQDPAGGAAYEEPADAWATPAMQSLQG